MNTPGNFLKAHFPAGYFDVSSSVLTNLAACLSYLGLSGVDILRSGRARGNCLDSEHFFHSSSKLYFAAFSETIYEKYGGAIDQIGLWNRVLSPAEVSQLFAWNTCGLH